MKKLINTSLFYVVLAMVGGVFYREFTKFNGFTGRTQLGFVHTHLFLLGMIMFLIILILNDRFDLMKSKRFNVFYYIYNVGVLITSIMLALHGTFTVIGTNLSPAILASISGVAGIGHILTGIGIILLFIILKERVRD